MKRYDAIEGYQQSYDSHGVDETLEHHGLLFGVTLHFIVWYSTPKQVCHCDDDDGQVGFARSALEVTSVKIGLRLGRSMRS